MLALEGKHLSDVIIGSYCHALHKPSRQNSSYSMWYAAGAIELPITKNHEYMQGYTPVGGVVVFVATLVTI